MSLRLRPTFVEVLVVIAIVGSLLGLLRPTDVGSAREHERMRSCGTHLSRIAAALNEYAAVHGSFPPAYVENRHGERMHSWRVLTLPYLDRQELYDAYDFHLPWNSFENQKLAADIAEAFQCPSDPGVKQPSPHTNYLAVVGPGTVWDKGHSSLSTDWPKETIMVVESVGDDVNVLEPRDLQVADMQWGISHQDHKSISSHHPDGSFVGLANGDVEFLHDTLDPNELLQRVAPGSAEAVDSR